MTEHPKAARCYRCSAKAIWALGETTELPEGWEFRINGRGHAVPVCPDCSTGREVVAETDKLVAPEDGLIVEEEDVFCDRCGRHDTVPELVVLGLPAGWEQDPDGPILCDRCAPLGSDDLADLDGTFPADPDGPAAHQRFGHMVGQYRAHHGEEPWYVIVGHAVLVEILVEAGLQPRETPRYTDFRVEGIETIVDPNADPHYIAPVGRPASMVPASYYGSEDEG